MKIEDRHRNAGELKWLLSAFFIVMASVILAGGYWFFQHETKIIKGEKYAELKAIAGLKCKQIVAWRQERLADARLYSASGLLGTEARRLNEAPGNRSLISDLASKLKLLRNLQGYENVILAACDGRVLFSINPRLKVLEPSAKALVVRAATSHQAVLGDFFRCPTACGIRLDVAAPLFDDQHQQVAVLILRTDPKAFLYPLIQTWPLPSKTGQTLLVRKEGKDVLFLNRLRHRRNPPLSLRLPLSRAGFPAALAVMGKPGEFEGTDYRGQTVLSDIRPVPGSPWYMVSEVDTDEIFGEIHREAYFIGFLALILVFFSAALMALIYKHRGKATFQALYRTERQRADVQEEFKTTLYSIGDAVIITDADGRVRNINPVAEQLTGWTERQTAGKPSEEMFQIIDETTREKVEDPIRQVLQKGGSVRFANHNLLIQKNGGEVAIACSGAPIRDGRKNIIGVVLVFRDQAKERETQRLVLARLRLLELAATCSFEELLQKMMDEIGALTQSPIGFCCFFDQDQNSITLQAYSTQTTEGFCKKEDSGTHYRIDRAGVWADCIHARKPVIHNDYNALPHKKGLPEGHGALIREMLVPIMRQERIVAVLGVGNKSTDYTDKDVEMVSYLSDFVWEIVGRKQTEVRLRENEMHFRRLYERSPVAYQSLDVRGHILEVNAAWLGELGYSRQEVIGKWFGDFLAGDGQKLFKNRFEAFKATGDVHGIEYEMKRKDGQLISVNFDARASRNADESFTMTHCVLVNITERKQREAALRALSSRQEALLSAIPDIIMEVDVNRVYTWANRAGIEFFGDDVIGRQASYYFEGQQATYEATQPLMDGQVELSYVESLQRRKDGKVRLLAWWCKLMRDQNGKVTGGLSSARDITDQKTLEDQFRQAQKMESVGRLAGGVAHDFNNMLSVIGGYAELALMRVGPSDPVHGELREILKAANRSTEISRQLLAFARKQTIAPRVLDLNETVESMLKMLRRLIGEDIDLAWAPDTNLWPVKMDPSQLDQILANLCVNARDAISGVGKVRLGTGNVTLDEDCCAAHADFIPGEFVFLTVSDNGCGMDKKTLSHLFEPFFTTKGLGRGTGLGMATVYGIVKQNNGFINVYSEAGQGTTFRIFLPRHVGKAEEVPEEHAGKIPPGRGELLLIVEDEETILDMSRQMLEKLGYRVLAASTPSQAIESARANQGPIQMLITDVVMPEMSGREMAEQLKQAFPEIKCLFMSGYTADAIANQGVLDEGVLFLQKPFSVKTLAEKVREALDAADPWPTVK